MKKLIILLLAVSPLCLKAQNNQAITIRNSTDITALGNLNEPLYILDGKEMDKSELQSINADNIQEISILKDTSAVALYGSKAAKGVVVVITKKFAITTYQEVFSTFSDDLESYLTGHGTDDAKFQYFINDVPVAKDKEEMSKLYALAKNKDTIESVAFVQDEPEGSKIAAKIKITTKK